MFVGRGLMWLQILVFYMLFRYLCAIRSVGTCVLYVLYVLCPKGKLIISVRPRMENLIRSHHMKDPIPAPSGTRTSDLVTSIRSSSTLAETVRRKGWPRSLTRGPQLSHAWPRAALQTQEQAGEV